MMSRLWTPLVIVTLAASFVAKMYLAMHADFWSDEMISLGFARHEDFRSIFWDNIPPTFYFVLKQWLHLVPESPLGLRSFNLVVSLLTPIIAYLSVVGTYGRNRALVFMMLLSLSSLSIMVGLEVRVYGVLEAAAVWNLFLFDRAIKGKTFPKALLFSWVLLVGLHYISLILVVTEVCGLLYFNTEEAKRALKKPKVLVGSLIAALGVLWALSYGVSYPAIAHRMIQDNSRYFVTFYNIVRDITLHSSSFMILLSVLLWRTKESQPLQFVFFFSLALTFIGSLVLGYNFENSRYLIFLNPLIFWFMTVHLTKPQNILNKVIVAALLALNLWSLVQVALMQRGGWREAREFIRSHYSSDNVAMMSPEHESFLFPYFAEYSTDVDEVIGRESKRLLVVVRRDYAKSQEFRDLYSKHEQRWELKSHELFGERSPEPVVVLALRSRVNDGKD